MNQKRLFCCIDYHEFITYTRMTIATCKIARVDDLLASHSVHNMFNAIVSVHR